MNYKELSGHDDYPKGVCEETHEWIDQITDGVHKCVVHTLKDHLNINDEQIERTVTLFVMNEMFEALQLGGMVVSSAGPLIKMLNRGRN